MGNYLISSKISSNTLTDKIRKFNENWDVSFFQDSFLIKLTVYDQIVENERIYVKSLLKEIVKILSIWMKGYIIKKYSVQQLQSL